MLQLVISPGHRSYLLLVRAKTELFQKPWLCGLEEGRCLLGQELWEWMRSERWQRLGMVGTATDCGAGGDTFHVSCGQVGMVCCFGAPV